jgi:Sec-independent protein translocase protein TatA
MTYAQIARAAGSSNGSIAAEIREFKKELQDKELLDKTLREREFKTVQKELQKTKAKIASLSQKIPKEERDKLEKSPMLNFSSETQEIV